MENVVLKANRYRIVDKRAAPAEIHCVEVRSADMRISRFRGRGGILYHHHPLQGADDNNDTPSPRHFGHLLLVLVPCFSGQDALYIPYPRQNGN